MRGKLAAVGLVERRESAVLGAFLDSYLAKRIDVKTATKTNWGHSRRNLIDFFGATKLLRDVTEADAQDFRMHLVGEKLAEATIRKRISNAKQFFRYAVKAGLISANPFAELKGTVKGNETRRHFISRDDAQKVIEACPDAQWRLLFALSRFGGLRCPSEHLALKWSDVDWERGRMLVTSPKTEHHEGKATRWVPIFAELRPHLEAVWEEAEPGTLYVITKYRSVSSNLRTQLRRIILRAGLKPWERPIRVLSG